MHQTSQTPHNQQNPLQQFLNENGEQGTIMSFQGIPNQNQTMDTYMALHKNSASGSNSKSKSTPLEIEPSSSQIISKRNLFSLSPPFFRTMKRGTCDATYLKMSYMIRHFGIMIPGSHMASNFLGWNTPSVNSILHHLRLSRTSSGLPCVSQRTFGTPSLSVSDTPSQHALLITDGGFQNDIRIDFLRQHSMDCLLFTRTVVGGMAEDSMALMILPTNNNRINFRLISQNNGVLRQSPAYYVNDPHDRYRDMRLDVENMSYEELLALEEVIGNVCTGLSDEASTKFLKQSEYFLFEEANAERESCSICQEDYKEKDKLGGLSCGHRFHVDCIKQWIKCKNICPICKSSGVPMTGPR
ncbi:Zinc finger, RING-type, partial [Dillenia turbinata]